MKIRQHPIAIRASDSWKCDLASYLTYILLPPTVLTLSLSAYSFNLSSYISRTLRLLDVIETDQRFPDVKHKHSIDPYQGTSSSHPQKHIIVTAWNEHDMRKGTLNKNTHMWTVGMRRTSKDHIQEASSTWSDPDLVCRAGILFGRIKTRFCEQKRGCLIFWGRKQWLDFYKNILWSILNRGWHELAPSLPLNRFKIQNATRLN